MQVADDEIYLVVNAGCREKDLAHINKYLEKFQVCLYFLNYYRLLWTASETSLQAAARCLLLTGTLWAWRTILTSGSMQAALSTWCKMIHGHNSLRSQACSTLKMLT